jgi:hypothetical protein
MEIANSVVWMFWLVERKGDGRLFSALHLQLSASALLQARQKSKLTHVAAGNSQHLPARVLCARREAPRHVRRAGMAVEENVEAALRAAGGVGDERVAVVLAVRERPLATSDPSHAKPAPLS